MSNIKVLIVEDELIIAEHMKVLLQELDYSIIGVAKASNEVEKILSEDVPDIALVDIKLWGDDDGIKLAKNLKEKLQIPIVFVTSNTDKATVNRAKEVKPDGYIVKPFEKEDLYTSIEIALSNFLKSKSDVTTKEEESYFYNEYLFVKKKYQFVKVKIQSIQWIKSEGNYLELNCADSKKYLIRSTFKDLFLNISLKNFLQVHKSYAINLEHIDSVRGKEILINHTSIPIGKMFQEEVKKHLNIIY